MSQKSLLRTLSYRITEQSETLLPVAAAAATVGGALTSLSAKIAAGITHHAHVMQQIPEQDIGWYTSEQEADELAVEWSVAFGLDARHAMATWLRFLELQERDPGFKNTDPHSAAACQSLIRQRFVKPVAITNFFDPHHSSCYRVFGTFREIKTHGYPAGAAVARAESDLFDGLTAPAELFRAP